jgi:hypothetical protein
VLLPSAVMAPVFTGKSHQENDGQQNNKQHADAKHHWVPQRCAQHTRNHISNDANGAATGTWITAGHGQVCGSPTNGGHRGEQKQDPKPDQLPVRVKIDPDDGNDQKHEAGADANRGFRRVLSRTVHGFKKRFADSGGCLLRN